MFAHILVPTDLAEKSIKGVEIAAKMVAGGISRRITLLHVIETIDDAEEEEFRPFYEKLRERAFGKMEDMVARIGSYGGNIHIEVLHGNRVREIVGFARENVVDLIVLGSHRIDNIDQAEGWATISYRVAILAHCPVLMVK